MDIKNGVSQKAILFNEQGRILIIRRSKTSPTRAGYWDLPGGILEDGEDKKEAIIREIKEETDLSVGEISVIDEATWSEGDSSWLTICYSGMPLTNDVELSYEHDDFQWITPQEFERLLALDAHKGFVKKFISSQNEKRGKG